jgi:site-specific DNA recombinase
MRAAIYTRISLDRTDESESPERQEAQCRQLIESRGWEVAEVFLDRDVSAYSRKRRPALEAMWQGLEDGRFDSVVVWKLDRLTRRFTDTGPIISRLQAAGAELVSVVESLDTSTPMGQGVLGILVAQAEQESKNTSMRVTAAWASAAARGKPHVGNRCFGYTKDFEQIPAEAAVARETVDKILSGQSLRSVATEMNEHSVTTALGKQWSHLTLRQWLRSPALAGIRVYRPMEFNRKTGKKQRAEHGTETQGEWKPIITPEERESLLVRLGSTRPSGERKVWLLSGLVYCKECGERMYGKTGQRQTRYACQKRPGTGGGCGAVTVDEKGLDRYVTEKALEMLSTIEMQPVDSDADPEALRRGIEEDDQRLKDLNRARFVLGQLSQEEWQPVRDEIVSRLEASRETLTAWERESSGTLQPGSLEDLQAWWEASTVEQRRLALSQTLSRIVIHPATVRGAKFDTGRIKIRVHPRWYRHAAAWAEEHGGSGELVFTDEAGNEYDVAVTVNT